MLTLLAKMITKGMVLEDIYLADNLQHNIPKIYRIFTLLIKCTKQKHAYCIVFSV